ncbi:MAG: DUF4834 family protein [Alistipes sp.]|nr:DUF4834 family protein [Alistipes sp.]
MNIFSAIIDSIVGFVSRNPLTTIIIVMLLVFAPSVFGVLFIGVIVLLLLTLAIPAFLLYRLRRASRDMEKEARRTSRQGGSGQYYGHQETKQEGEVKVHSTTQQPPKRVNDNVGDYVDFEEVKEQK